ncbi:NADPH-dependent 1-acyl dihydroxyacetone phosphate reductase [Taxawa tesnikishii (nom. ined.)]|nr:NADPH-dependent 1-acyl dihydroxyacetone phosphate reductase [Dothideales sp. JES 119]
MASKTVVVTGTNPGGIGNSLAREFHARGLRVFATARNTSAITDLADLGISTHSLEVTSSDSIIALRDEILALTDGKLDYLVNNAGRNYTVPASEMDLSEVRAMFDVNVFGVMEVTQAFIPALIQAKGTIVQIGSLAAVMPYVFGSSYNASKAALHAYSDTLRLELKEFGVRVVTVVTGGVKSRIARTTRALKDDSIYLPIEEGYMRRQQHSQEVGMPNERYAKSVVGQVLGRPGKKEIWEGNMSWLVWFANAFLPRGFFDWYFSRAFQLWRLRGVAAKKRE